MPARLDGLSSRERSSCPLHPAYDVGLARPRPRQPRRLVRVVADQLPACGGSFAARLTISSSSTWMTNIRLSRRRRLARLTRTAQPSANVGSIDSPAPRMIRHSGARRPCRFSQARGNLILPVMRSVSPVAPAPAHRHAGQVLVEQPSRQSRRAQASSDDLHAPVARRRGIRRRLVSSWHVDAEPVPVQISVFGFMRRGLPALSFRPPSSVAQLSDQCSHDHAVDVDDVLREVELHDLVDLVVAFRAQLDVPFVGSDQPLAASLRRRIARRRPVRSLLWWSCVRPPHLRRKDRWRPSSHPLLSAGSPASAGTVRRSPPVLAG